MTSVFAMYKTTVYCEKQQLPKTEVHVMGRKTNGLGRMQINFVVQHCIGEDILVP